MASKSTQLGPWFHNILLSGYKIVQKAHDEARGSNWWNS